MDLDLLTRQIRYNCDVSDARHAGIYSICGLALRLRDLYKWDQSLEPWQEHEAARVLDWIGRREALWESLADAQLQSVTVAGRDFDAFDSQAVNCALTPLGFFYGAGYAHSLKPTFFLARIDQVQTIRGRIVWRLGQELARDLLTLPAFSQDDQVVLRTQAARMYLWDQIAYLPHSGRPALSFALAACCSLRDADAAGLRRHLDTIMEIQHTTYIRHELGELGDEVFDRAAWRSMLADFPHTPAELLIRTLKDMLADTGPEGPLVYFSRLRSRAGLGFYMAFSGGLTPALFGELKAGFNSFMQNGQWNEIDRAIGEVHQKAAAYARRVMEIYAAGPGSRDPAATRRAIEEILQENGVLQKKGT